MDLEFKLRLFPGDILKGYYSLGNENVLLWELKLP